MVVATKTQLNQLKENPVGGLSSRKPLLSFRNSFLKSYASSHQNMSDESLSALLLYFALGCLEQNSLIKIGLSKTSKNELLAQSKHLFDLLQDFLPAEIGKVFPPPNIMALEQAQLFFESNPVNAITKANLFKDVANLGFAYQIFSLGLRSEDALPALQSANKTISRRQLITFTQLYTPGWVVDFLVANAILPSFPHWKEKLPSKYTNWLLSAHSSNKKNVELTDFNILDPACGAGQFLLSSFDLLLSLFEIAGHKKDDSVNLTLSNIYGADIDEKALWVTGLGLLCKSLLATKSPPKRLSNLVWSGKNKQTDFLGSIDRAWTSKDILGRSYSAIVTNPPYLGRKCLSRELKVALQKQYPDSSADLCAAFIERSTQMLKPGGRVGVITQASLLSIPSYQTLRNYLFNNYHFETIVRCGPGVFPLASGEKIDSVLLLARAPNTNDEAITQASTQLYDLSSIKDKLNGLERVIEEKLANKTVFSTALVTEANSQVARLTEGSAFGLPFQLLDKFTSFPKLGDIADIRQGLATTDNARFVRYHFDVDTKSIGSLWIPYIKGAGGEQFTSDNPFVVKWGNKGEEIKKAVTEAYPYLKGKTAWVVKNEEFYFRPRLCFSFINKSGLAVRRLPAGAIFDVGSSAIFAKPEDEDFLLAYLNSSLVGLLAKTINQTINIQVGDLKKLPILPFSANTKSQLTTLGQKCFVAKEKLLQMQYTDFKSMHKISRSLINAAQLELFFTNYETEHNNLSKKLKNLQLEIDSLVCEGLKESGKFDAEEENYLLNSLSSRTSDIKDLRFDRALLARKMFVSLIANLVCNNQQTERIKLIPKIDSLSLATSLGLSDDGKDLLEQHLGSSLEKLLCRSKVTEISKLAKEPSRYFSLFLEKNYSYMFFSANAVRLYLKSPKADHSTNWFWQPVCEKLKKIEDWTSKDLLEIIIETYN